MEKKDLIIALITEDIKHNQLVQGLRNLGFDDHGEKKLNLMSIVARLMGVEEIDDHWCDTYMQHIDEGSQQPLLYTPHKLSEVATHCYWLLHQ